MNCREYENHLQEQLDGSSVMAPTGASEHLAECARCRALSQAARLLEGGLPVLATPTPPPDLSQRIVTRVLAARRRRLVTRYVLGFTWGKEGANSEVLFELAPQGDKVMLTLTHRKLPTREEMVNVSGGWHLHLTLLEHQLAGTKPPRFWDTFAKLEPQYEARVPR